MMLAYRLDDLGWFEFEQLVQALLKSTWGPGIEAWGGRGDWGRDAYYEGDLSYPTKELCSGAFVFQCKFVEGANAAGAKPRAAVLRAVNLECRRINERLESGRWPTAPTTYTFLTNAPLSASLRRTIRERLQDTLPACRVTVQDGNDICAMMRTVPDLIRSFPQLLTIRDLNSLLKEVVAADVIVRSESAISLAQKASKTFVPTSAYYDARRTLRAQAFVVLEGPPEMGKTTIGRIIALTQLLAGWDALECRSPKDILKTFDRRRSQVFVADDFFGRTEYEPARVNEWQAELAHVLPLLDSTHWLILTCRAHLLQMAKADLDISEQNDQFPTLGEVVVNAAELTTAEKARILYRHARERRLDDRTKLTLRSHARDIVNSDHFTPERIRRLIEALPALTRTAANEDSFEINAYITEFLSNPTKQMRVSFRKLPTAHRWLLFSLLEGNDLALWEAQYHRLCPPTAQESFSRVLAELTEGFVGRAFGFFEDTYDWVHPSCRDLAIEELAASPQDRHRFLRGCSSKGMLLATSVGGGIGTRKLPLLETDDDWALFRDRALELAVENASLAYSLHLNSVQLGKFHDLAIAEQRLRRIVSTELLPIALKNIDDLVCDDIVTARHVLTCARDIGVIPTTHLDRAWSRLIDDLEAWLSSSDPIRENAPVYTEARTFISLLADLLPAELQRPERLRDVQALCEQLLDRHMADNPVDPDDYEDPEDRSNLLDSLNELRATMKTLRTLPFWDSAYLKAIDKTVSALEFESNSVADSMSEAPDDEHYEVSEPPEDSSVSIDDIFTDL